MSLFQLRGSLSTTTRTILELAGFGLLILVWYLLTAGANPVVETGILPRPIDVLRSFGDLYQDNDLIVNVFKSIGLNLAGYVEALVIALPIGFLVGLYPLFRGGFQRQVDAFRYVPLTAVTGLFIIWFGLGTPMKVHFLAFGILIYLLPVVVQRIDEVKDVYLKTVYTIGATDWQTIRTVYIPSVISRLSDDIRVLTAISWTYIIIAESLGNQGGIGALIWRTGQRQGRVDKVFALLLIIILIGFIQDKVFTYLDREFFPHKYQSKGKHDKERSTSIWQAIADFAFSALTWAGLAIYLLLFLDEVFHFFTESGVLTQLFGGTVNVIHLIFFLVLFYKVRKLFIPKERPKKVAV